MPDMTLNSSELFSEDPATAASTTGVIVTIYRGTSHLQVVSKGCKHGGNSGQGMEACLHGATTCPGIVSAAH